MQPYAKHGQNSEQILDEFLLRGKRFPIDDHNVRMMAFAEGFKVAVPKANEPITMSNDDKSDFPQLHHLHEPIELFALVVEPTANILHPLIDLVGNATPWAAIPVEPEQTISSRAIEPDHREWPPPLQLNSVRKQSQHHHSGALVVKSLGPDVASLPSGA